MTLVAATLAASLWMVRRETPGRRALVYAGIASGFAVATKFSLLWTPLLPLVALLLTQHDWRHQLKRDLGVLVAAVLGAFLASEPYAVIEFGRFLAGVGFEVSHYAFVGHPGQDRPAGFAQLGRIAQTLMSSFGPAWLSMIVLALSVMGTFRTVARNWRAAVLLLGWMALQLYVLTQQLVFFERGLLPLLPPLVVLAAVGADMLPALVRRGGRAPEPRHRTADRLIAAAIGLAFLPSMGSQWQDARAAWITRDSRTLATEWLVARVQPGEQVAISNQLPFDLTELRRHRIAFRLVDPVAVPCWFSLDPYAFYVTSADRGPVMDAPVLAAFDGRAVTTDEPLFSPAVERL
jgi:hypothetical protein